MKKRFTDRLLKIGNRSILAALAAIGFPAYAQLSKPVTMPPLNLMQSIRDTTNQIKVDGLDSTNRIIGDLGLGGLYGCPGVVFIINGVSGMVYDKYTGDPIPGAKIDIINDGRIIGSVETNENGKFGFYDNNTSINWNGAFIRIGPTYSINGRKYKQAEKAVLESNIFIGLEREN